MQLAYEGHTVASAMGTAPGMLALQDHAGSCEVRADGTLDMDSTLAAWSKETWSRLESGGNRVPGVHVKGDSVAGVLWLWSRVIMTHRDRGSIVTSCTVQLALHLVSVVLGHLQLGLSRWAIEQEEPCTAQMIALQKAGRRTHPGILTRLMKMNRKGKAVRSWTELACKSRPAQKH